MSSPRKPANKAEREALRRQMLADGYAADPIAEEMRVRYRVNPRVAARWALGLSQQQAVDRYNETVRRDGQAYIDATRLSRYENWPDSGINLSIYALVDLAKLYGTNPRKLVTYDEYRLLPKRDRDVLDNWSRHQDSVIWLTDRQIPPSWQDRSAPSESSPTVLPVEILEQPQSSESLSLWIPAQGVMIEGDIILAAAHESSEFARKAGMTNVGPTTLEQLDAEIRRLARDYMTRPPSSLVPEIIALRAQAFSLLEGHQYPDQTKHLYLVTGQLCGLLAHAAFDVGNGHAAETHARTAWLCGNLAGHDSLRAYARWVQSNVAYWDGRIDDTAGLASSGQEYATTGTTMIRLASQEARAQARLGNRHEVEQALKRAADARENIQGSDEVGVFRFQPGKAAYYASEAHAGLGGRQELQRAEAEAQEALELFRSAGPEDRSTELVAAAYLDVAAARLALNDLDATIEGMRMVLDTPPEHRTVPVVQRVQRLGEALAGSPSRKSLLGADLSEEIRTFCTHPATSELPPPAST